MNSSTKELLQQEWQDHLDAFHNLDELFPLLDQAAEATVKSLARGRKILLMGNGGSAADAQHIAAEIVGRYKLERAALPAIALTTDTSILTAVGNDYGYEDIFRRQIAGLASPGDIVLSYSTSGNSPNIIRAVNEAKSRNCLVIGLTGIDGGQLKSLADICLCVPSTVTARIQECHAFLGHHLCSRIDAAVSEGTIPCS